MKLPANYLQIEQGSAAWFEARCGLVTASHIAEVMSRLKNGGTSQKRENYKLELLQEIWTGQAAEHFVTPAMDRGIQLEGPARSAYEMATGVEVERIGFVLHPHIPRCGASPDGLVGDDGLVEIKVPQLTTHIGYMAAEIVPREYVPQMMWQMACSGRKWNDFVSYGPELPNGLDLFIVRLERDDEMIAEMEEEVARFITELNECAERLNKRVTVSTAAGPPRAEIPDEDWFDERVGAEPL